MKDYGSIQKSSSPEDLSPGDTTCGQRQAALPLISAAIVSLLLLATYFDTSALSSRAMPEKTLSASIGHSFTHARHQHNPEQPLFFDQIINHDEPCSSGGTFPQRYYMDDQYWKGPGHPIFIIFGGEGPLERILYPFISKIMAKAFGGITYNLEHRYFGVSFPHNPPTKKQLAEELTPRQVIEDMVYFIQEQRQALGCTDDNDDEDEHESYCPVMTVGASYAGLLSTLIRKTYPDVVDMAYAASPCLLLFSHQTTPYVYYEYVTEVADRLSGGCRAAVQESIAELKNELRNISTVDQVAKVAPDYGICGGGGGAEGQGDARMNLPKRIMNGLDLASELISYTANQFISTNMDFYPPTQDQKFYQGCTIFEQHDKPVAERMKKYIQTMSSNESGEKCLSLDPSEEEGDFWDALCCYLLPMIGKSNDTMWPASPYSFEKEADACQRHFGIIADPDYLENEFGLSDMSHVDRLVLTNGYNDGWFPLSYTQDHIPGSNVVVLNMENGAHHSDLTHQLQADTPDVELVHRQILDLVGEWLEEIRNNHHDE